MNNIIISVHYDNINYSDILKELYYVFGTNSTINDYCINNDVRWDYDNYSFTDNTYYGVKCIGMSRIDGSLLFKIDNTVPIDITIVEIFSYFNYSFKLLNTKLSFKEYVRKIKIESFLKNEPIPNKFRISTLPSIKLISSLEDHISKFVK